MAVLRKSRNLFGHRPARLAKHFAWMLERVAHELGIVDPLGYSASEQIVVTPPGLKCRFLARRCDIGIVKADRSSEDL
jgi:hypothetical protein